ncbi:hypothetical protein [Actinocatenispora thailandica]|uniref:hypothetical protein n=1 Tax=Actinocatenispora thailandica TaxID=227318 RepID=UPI0031DF29EE
MSVVAGEVMDRHRVAGGRVAGDVLVRMHAGLLDHSQPFSMLRRYIAMIDLSTLGANVTGTTRSPNRCHLCR